MEEGLSKNLDVHFIMRATEVSVETSRRQKESSPLMGSRSNDLLPDLSEYALCKGHILPVRCDVTNKTANN